MISINAEQSVIGSLLKNNDVYWEIQDQVSVNDFSRNDHRLIFSTICKMIENNQPVDIITITDYNNDIQLSYVGQLAKDTPTHENAKAYAKIVRDKAQKRETSAILQAALEKLQNENNIQSIVSDTQGQLEGIAGRETGKSTTIVEVIRTVLKNVESIKDEKNSCVGIGTGIHGIDGRTGGIHGGRLWCVAARPGAGKTAMTLQWALHGAKSHRVGILSLEMNEEELGLRALANQLQVNMTAFSYGYKNVVEVAHKKLPTSALKDLNIWLETNVFTLSGIVSKITEWKRKHKIDYAIIDHIGLVETDEFSTRNDQVGKVSRTLKKLAKRLEMPIIIAAQLNRGNERDSRKPKLSDLRDSGNIEQDIDVGIFIHANETGENPVSVEIGLLKNRQGRKGWLPNKYFFDGATQTFSESANVTG